MVDILELATTAILRQSLILFDILRYTSILFDTRPHNLDFAHHLKQNWWNGAIRYALQRTFAAIENFLSDHFVLKRKFRKSIRFHILSHWDLLQIFSICSLSTECQSHGRLLPILVLQTLQSALIFSISIQFKIFPCNLPKYSLQTTH